MTARRIFWRLATPFVAIAHRLGACSYKWVNVCRGSWRLDRFDPLWHYQWYGTPITAIPAQVILRGIGYEAAATDGAVVFIEEFTRRRIVFRRNSAAIWEVSSVGSIDADRVCDAYAWVKAASFFAPTNRRVSEQAGSSEPVTAPADAPFSIERMLTQRQARRAILGRALLLAVAAVGVAPAQVPAWERAALPLSFATVSDSLRARLIADWNRPGWRDVERKYCVVAWDVGVTKDGDSVYIATQVELQRTTGTRTQVTQHPECISDRGRRLPSAHTHVTGDCSPSRADITRAINRRAPFDLIVCGPGVTLGYVWSIYERGIR